MTSSPTWRIVFRDWRDADRASKLLEAADIWHQVVPPSTGESRPYPPEPQDDEE